MKWLLPLTEKAAGKVVEMFSKGVLLALTVYTTSRTGRTQKYPERKEKR